MTVAAAVTVLQTVITHPAHNEAEGEGGEEGVGGQPSKPVTAAIRTTPPPHRGEEGVGRGVVVGVGGSLYR